MKRLVLVLVAASALAAFAAAAPPPITNLPSRRTISLNGRWQYMVDIRRAGYDSRWPAFDPRPPRSTSEVIEFKFTDRQTIDVPGDWNSQVAGLDFYEGLVWYKRDFAYSPGPATRVFLVIGSANFEAEAWLNGKPLGRHAGGFTPFQFEVTDKLKPGDNILVLAIDNRRRADGLPGLEYDWWNYGGLTGDVLLVETPETFIRSSRIGLVKGSLEEAAVEVVLDGSKRSAKSLTASIPALGWKQTAISDAEGRASFRLKGKLRLWSPSDPYLYEVLLSTDSETLRERVGFRSIETRGPEILLNGKPVFLRGISMHEEIPERRARACDEADARRLLERAGDLGCNFVRLAHYPYHPSFARLADEMGLLVWEEIPVYWGVDFKNPETQALARDMLGELIARDANRASVIIWSIGNETPVNPERTKFMTRLAAEARAADPSRLVSCAFSYPGDKDGVVTVDDPLSASLDVLAVNEYLGWYTPWRAEPKDYRWKLPANKPLIMSEFGGEAVFGNPGSADAANSWGEEYQAALYRKQIEMLARIPELAGLSPWILADFRSPVRLNLTFQNGWNRKGLLSDQGEKKKAWYVLADFYRQRAGSESARSAVTGHRSSKAGPGR